MLTDDEKAIVSRIDLDLASLADAFYANTVSLGRGYKKFYYLGNIFDDEKQQIWVDEVGHITPEGNRLVAQEIQAIIDKQLADN